MIQHDGEYITVELNVQVTFGEEEKEK